MVKGFDPYNLFQNNNPFAGSAQPMIKCINCMNLGGLQKDGQGYWCPAALLHVKGTYDQHPCTMYMFYD